MDIDRSPELEISGRTDPIETSEGKETLGKRRSAADKRTKQTKLSCLVIL